ncbi:copper resistance CopC family protein [Kitasatospora sp. NPDC002551]|uniref:copper resistance CopC family protein n=1 Tax=unclassified Kitasatospora TaxID=2633591 RepID=UPI003321279F
MSGTGSTQSFQRAVALGVGVVVLLLVGLLWISARQPVRLASVTPADGSGLAQAPSEVALTFSGDDFQPGSVYLQVNGPNGLPVSDGSPRLDGRRLVSPVRIDAEGTYQVTYRLVLDGGREVSGTTAFGVGAATAIATDSRPVADPADEGSPTHEHGIEGAWNVLLLCADAVLLPSALYLVFRRPRLRRPRARPGRPYGETGTAT